MAVRRHEGSRLFASTRYSVRPNLELFEDSLCRNTIEDAGRVSRAGQCAANGRRERIKADIGKPKSLARSKAPFQPLVFDRPQAALIGLPRMGWCGRHIALRVLLTRESNEDDATPNLWHPVVLCAKTQHPDVIPTAKRLKYLSSYVALKLLGCESWDILGDERLRLSRVDAADELRPHIANVGGASLTASDRERLTRRPAMDNGYFASQRRPIRLGDVTVDATVHSPIGTRGPQRLRRVFKNLERGRVVEPCPVEAKIEATAATEQGQCRQAIGLQLWHQVPRVELRHVHVVQGVVTPRIASSFAWRDLTAILRNCARWRAVRSRG